MEVRAGWCGVEAGGLRRGGGLAVVAAVVCRFWRDLRVGELLFVVGWCCRW
jgi:hypothetical protein